MTIEADDWNGVTDTATVTVTVTDVAEGLELWSGTMTAESFTLARVAAYGYTTGVMFGDYNTEGPHGTLDDTSFTYGGETYTIEIAAYVGAVPNNPLFFLGLDERRLPEDTDMALYVDERRLEDWITTGLQDIDTMYYYVEGIDLTLSAGQEVELSLRKTNPSSDTGLASLALSTGTLSPEFDAGTSSYTATVANDVAEVTVTAVASSDYATVSVSPQEADDATTEGVEVALVEGENAVTVTVTAEDGTTQDYTITTTRETA